LAKNNDTVAEFVNYIIYKFFLLLSVFLNARDVQKDKQVKLYI